MIIYAALAFLRLLKIGHSASAAFRCAARVERAFTWSGEGDAASAYFVVCRLRE